MKDTASTKKQKNRMSVRQAISAVFVCGIVLVVPVFSVIEFGHFFRGNDTRTDITLPVMTQRAADKTQLPVKLFEEPVITVTFDDGFESIYTNALPLLQKYGIRSTQYILGGTADNVQYVNWEQIGQMKEAGHQIACHSMTHADLTTLDSASLDYELRQCKTELSTRYGIIPDFASPYGSQNATTIAAISKYYDSQRNTNGDPTNGVNEADVNTAENFNRYNIIGVTIRKQTTVKELRELVDYAKKHNGWVVLTYHQTDEGDPSTYAVDTANMEKQFKYLSSTNVRIETMQAALQATRLQNAEF